MTRTPDAWAALRAHPWRYLGSRWPWGALAYLLTTVPIGIVMLVVLLGILFVGALTAVVVVGLVVLAGIPVLAGVLGVLERARLRLVQGAPASGMSLRERLRAGRRLPVSWPEVGYAFLVAVVLWPLDALVVLAVFVSVTLILAPLLATVDTFVMLGWEVEPGPEAWLAAAIAVPALPLAAYVVGVLAVAQAALARQLLSPRDAALAQAVADLRRSRVDLVDAFETERRRIERDLHDGVQQRLVALTMTLGSAELDVPEGPGLNLVRQAHRQAEEALEELRTTVRGIHPRVLADHGLAAAVHEIADRSLVPVTVEIRLDERLPAPVETAAYFVVSEALTNVARHSGARRAQVHGWRRAGSFILAVVDDGQGGAVVDRASGSGLAGLAVRLDALGGGLRVTSPTGGPTEVRMEAPCAGN
ncbi:sensor domain-containing protein [Nocardioides pantholopis]|uniref:sensor domain-containing protein n=1 Tax=Nocardioides pantholopis TaxID=2483798 RepID=UPI000FDCA775|nr:sensor domain-containing protein [Nocardioides pantholopis]